MLLAILKTAQNRKLTIGQPTQESPQLHIFIKIL